MSYLRRLLWSITDRGYALQHCLLDVRVMPICICAAQQRNQPVVPAGAFANKLFRNCSVQDSSVPASKRKMLLDEICGFDFKVRWRTREEGHTLMVVLLVAVIFGIAIAYFGMQNISPVTIRLNEYVWNDVPLYLVIVGSLFVGLFIAGILYFARSVSSRLTIYGKDRAMKKARHTVGDLEQRVRELEAETARLKATDLLPSEIPYHKLS